MQSLPGEETPKFRRPSRPVQTLHGCAPLQLHSAPEACVVNFDQYNQCMTEWIDAAAARARLGVRAQTLYAYASRGRLRVDADPENPRKSRYLAADVEALAA